MKEDETKLIHDLAAFKRALPVSDQGIKLEPWRSAIAKERIGMAKKIWHQSVSSYASIQDSEKELASFVRRGGQLRCILTDPEGIAIERGVMRNLGISADIYGIILSAKQSSCEGSSSHLLYVSGYIANRTQ